MQASTTQAVVEAPITRHDVEYITLLVGNNWKKNKTKHSTVVIVTGEVR